MEDVFHALVPVEVEKVQTELLKWYAKTKRTMPWRDLEPSMDLQVRAYRVLVSEIMLQQTQVNTVINYYNNWISTWPTLSSLSQANLEEVQKAWKGLGYYSRGRRLLELAQKVSKLPVSAQELAKLPGIGAYTSGAVASIAFGKAVPAVDGNVVRVLCRLRAIGGVVTTARVKKAIWQLAESLVPVKNPGDWNQALMELGATVCTPRSPNCAECPLRSICRGYNGESHDIEECWLCLPKDRFTGLPTNYPQKVPKVVARKEMNIVCILNRKKQYFVVKRNSTGLLADLWQFPCFPATDISETSNNIWCAVWKSLQKHCQLTNQPTYVSVGDVDHKFSHISMTYRVLAISLSQHDNPSAPPGCCASSWVPNSEFQTLPVSTAMRKVFAAYLQYEQKKGARKRKRKNKD